MKMTNETHIVEIVPVRKCVEATLANLDSLVNSVLGCGGVEEI